MIERLRTLVESDGFRSSVLALIVLNAAAMGVEATPDLAENSSALLDAIFVTSQVLFVLEIVARVLAHHPHPARFFADSWNRFDFALVTLSLVPAVDAFALVGRVLRVLRLLRVVSVSAAIRGSFVREDRGLRALGPAAALAAVLCYVFALVGFHLFGGELPDQWGSLSAALSSLRHLFTPDGLSRAVRPSSAQPLMLRGFSILFLAAVVSMLVNTVQALLARPKSGGSHR